MIDPLDCGSRELGLIPRARTNLDDYAMTVAEQWFYRDDALRLDNRKQFFGVCVKPTSFSKDQFRNKSKFSIGEKQDDPVLPRVADRRYERRNRNCS